MTPNLAPAGEFAPFTSGETPRGPKRLELEALDGIIELVYQRSRIRLNRSKEALIRGRLGKRMRALALSSLPEYWAWLRSPAGSEEAARAVDALTTNFTHFFREREHFEFMVDEALPSLVGSGKKRFSVWSAACATGEEPYTIGFQLSERFPPAAGWDWRVLATDISNRVLEKARAGVYAEDRLNGVPKDWVRKYFQRGVGSCSGLVRVKTAVTARVEFRQMNLLEDQPNDPSFEIVFCRNVMIYFDRPTQERLAIRIARALVPRGYLFTGRAESLNGLAVPLRCVKPSIYQRPD
jgi:chemotaxis protein methyltransferase CheR